MSPPRDRWLAIIYAAAIFTSAFLLFQIQPLVSKRILPWFGGTPAVWTTCLLFFQTVLFAGYAYAHWSNSHLKSRQQAIVHIGLILLALLLMHAAPSERWEPTASERPISQILVILAASIGLPYFVLSATGPLLQAWFARTFPGRIPYRLYALSNIGSLLALASYPFFFEPAFDLPRQALFWTSGFVVYAALCAFIAWRIFSPSPSGESSRRERGRREGARKKPKPPADLLPTSPPPTPPLYFVWLILSAFASLILIATTNQISTDIAVMPLLWVAPLAIYLITFIIAFDRPAWYRRIPTAMLAVVATYAAAVAHHFGVNPAFFYELGTLGIIASNFGDPGAPPPEFQLSAIHFLIANFAALFAICLLCHGEISRSRPAPRFLTSFYLMISAGGALGGIFATLIAPSLFSAYFEWDAAMFTACLAAVALLIYAATVRLIRRTGTSSNRSRRLLTGTALIGLLGISLVALIDITEFLGTRIQNIQWSARNFFGTLRVQVCDAAEEEWRRNVLFHGTIVHGAQYTQKARRREPTTYFSRKSGVGRAIDYFHKHLPPGQLRMGVVGLGAGTLAAYPERGESITFYEINPIVIKLAEGGEWFTYLGDCRARGAHCEIRLGDARLTLKRELSSSASALRVIQTKSGPLPRSGEGSPTEKSNTPSSYHLLVLDAFSGDSIPTHLLTTQAFELYLASLAPANDKDGKPTESGAIAIHISNLYLDLEPVVRAAALRFKLLPMRFYSQSDEAIDAYNADWIIVTRNTAMADELRAAGTPGDASRPPVLWTDDRSSLFEVLR